MERCRIEPTEFYDIAAQQGLYGLELGGIVGKKDYVRKYWEDVVIKLTIRNPIYRLLEKKNNIRVMDLGCGSGEGYELLRHIPVNQYANNKKDKFVLNPKQISYLGVDISEAMILQGRKNYPVQTFLGNIRFERADLNEGLPFAEEEPFDIYFSSYASLSHLRPDKLQKLIEDIFSHVYDSTGNKYIVLDLLGKYSLEWPKYWEDDRMMLPYNMAYLMKSESYKDIQWCDACFYSPSSLDNILDAAAKSMNIDINTQYNDRSLFVGRHMATGLFGAPRFNYRYQVNCLFDHDHKEEIEHLFTNLYFYKEYRKIQPQICERINDYNKKWNCIINIVDALLHGEDKTVSNIIETTSQDMSNELKFLTWLYRNAHRFPAIDFWANVMGPQIAVILRNIEMSFSPALGCGHGLLCVIEIGE